MGWGCSWPACVAPAVMQMIRSERGFSHFCNSWILLGDGDVRRFVSKRVSRRAYCSLCSPSAGDSIKTPLPVYGVAGCSWDRPFGFPLWPEPWLGKSSAFFGPFGPFVAHRGSQLLFLEAGAGRCPAELHTDGPGILVSPSAPSPEQ